MKKILFILSALLLFVSGCEKKPNEVFTYGLSKSTFESYYDVSTSIDRANDPYKIVLKATPKHTYETSDSTVSVSIYFEYIFNFELVKEIRSGVINLSNSNELNVELVVGSNHKIVGYTIDQAVGFISAETEITAESKVYAKPFEFEEAIIVEDKQESLSNYQTLMGLINDMKISIQSGFKLDKEAEMTVSMGEFTDTTTEQIVEHYVKSPFYYHAESTDSELIIHEGMMYEYSGTRYKGAKYLETDVVSDNEASALVLHLTDALNYETTLKSSFLYQKTGESYKVTALVKDVLDAETYQAMIDLYTQMGMDKTVFEKSRIFMVFDFSDELTIETAYSLVYSEQNLVVTSKVTEKYSLSYETLNPTEDTAYLISYPDQIGEVNTLTDYLTETYQTEPGKTHVYKGYLEKGIYELKLDNDLIQYALYDESGNRLIFSYPDISDLKPYIEIKESGLYYIKIDLSSLLVQTYYRFSLELTNLNDYLNVIDLSGSTTHSIELESEEDMILLSYPFTGKKIIHFNFEIDAPITFYFKNQFGYDSVEITGAYTYALTSGKNDFYIKGLAKGTVSYQLEDINQNLYNSNFDLMMFLPSNQFEQDFFYGGAMGRVYLRFIILEAGFYQYSIKGDFPVLFEYYDSYAIQQWYVVDNQADYLEPGTYYLSFISDTITSGNASYQKLYN